MDNCSQQVKDANKNYLNTIHPSPKPSSMIRSHKVHILKLTCLDFSQISKEFQTLYRELISLKKLFISMYPTELEDKYLVSAESFARQLMLDPSDCDNPTFILPQLTRDSFSKKGLFYRTDKILIQNFSSSF